MYTNGEVIIERKESIIVLTTRESTISYLFRTKTEACNSFITLIMEHEKIKNNSDFC